MNLCKDDITRSLFARLRRSPRKEPQSQLLKCPKCGLQLRPLLLDMFEERGVNYQRVWWTCRGLKTKTCMFPLNMPPEVFWTKRSEDQIHHNVIPLPNYNLLPDDLKYLYPFLMNDKLTASPSKRSSTKSTSRSSNQNGKDSTSTAGEKIPIQEDVILDKEMESLKAHDAEILENAESMVNQEEMNLDELKKRETARKERKRKNKSEGPPPLWGKKQLQGVINASTAKSVQPSVREIRKKGMRPFQERIVAGGRNFNFSILDETVTPSTAAKVNLFPDIHSSLKTALALRFAKKDYLEKVNTLLGEAGASFNSKDSTNERHKIFQKLSELFPEKYPESSQRSSQEEDGATECSDTASTRSSEKEEPVTSKASNDVLIAFRDVERKTALSSRLGIKLAQPDKEDQSSFLPMNDDVDQFFREASNEMFDPLSVQTENNDSSTPSTSNLSMSSSPAPINSSFQEKTPTNFDSPELHNIVQKHLHLLRSKSEKKRRRKPPLTKEFVEEGNVTTTATTQLQEQHDPLVDFPFHQNGLEDDYGIFSLDADEEDGDFGYDLFTNL